MTDTRSIYDIADEIARAAVEDAAGSLADEEDICADDIADAAYDYVHDAVDGCREVIYTGMAWDIVARYSDECARAADEMGIDLASVLRERGLDGMASALAYCGIYVEASARVYDTAHAMLTA